jgi:hypothetical protein
MYACHLPTLLVMAAVLLQGSGPVDSAVKNADRTDVIPWRPKVWRAPDLIVMVACGLYSGLVLWELLFKASPDGIVHAATIGLVLNCWKQYQLFPAGSSDLQKRLDVAWKNISRCALDPTVP